MHYLWIMWQIDGTYDFFQSHYNQKTLESMTVFLEREYEIGR